MTSVKNETSFNERKQMMVFLFFVLLIAMIWQTVSRSNIRQDGVYLPAKVIKKETTKGGYISTLEYRYSEEIIRQRVWSKPGVELNQYYFIKMKPPNLHELIFLQDSPVPDCLLSDPLPSKGWREIPKCASTQ